MTVLMAGWRTRSLDFKGQGHFHQQKQVYTQVEIRCE
jgi:hypothetical protein